MFTVSENDSQREAVYSLEPEICRPVHDEVIGEGAAKSVTNALWETHIDLPLRPPRIVYNREKDIPTYYAWEHEITLNSKPNKTCVVSLIHEIAHAKLGALGIGPFVESHGSFFCYVFGQMWSTYTTKPYAIFERRCEDNNLLVSNGIPDLDEYPWAVVLEGGRKYAVRPAHRAIELGWNITKTFSLNIKENHPMG